MKVRSLVVLLLCCLCLAGCTGKESGKEDSSKLTQNDLTAEKAEPTQAPEPEQDAETTEETKEQEPYILTFEAKTVDNETWNSDKLADAKLTMINVWATYCNPCLSEMPDLGEIASEYDRTQFQLIGIISDVMADDDAETVAYAKELIAETMANYPHLLLNESLYQNLVGAVSGVPTTFFVNDTGELLGYVVGAQSKDTWKGIIDQLLAEME